MRKRLIDLASTTIQPRSDSWLDLDAAATVEVTSEEKDFPIEASLSAEQTQGWRADEPGPQTIRLLFDERQKLRHVSLVFEERESTRTQEFVLRWSSERAGALRELGAGPSQTLKEGNPMRGVVLSLSHLPSILLVSLLVLSTHVLWAQRTSTLEESTVRLPDAPSRVATESEAQTHFLTYKRLPLSLKQNQGQTESWMRFFPDHTGYDLSINTKAVLNQDTGTAQFWAKNKYFIGSAPTKWSTFAPTFGLVHHEAIHGVDELEYYGHHIPWAGSVILRIGQQAKAHPHITTVLKSVHPKF